jgi:DNA-binding winged helix-turn-helix (wHTH) protein/Tol biopolymer transport system component
MDEISTPDYEFAGFRLDTALQVLISPAGAPIALPSRAFDTLKHLVERAGELVDKRALMKAVWPSSVVEENNLNQCVLTIRRALGEEAGERAFILTVPGRGFKFVAPVVVMPRARQPLAGGSPALDDAPAVPAAAPGPAVALPNAARPVRGLRGGWLPLTGAALGLALIGGAILLSRPHRPVTSPAEYQALTDLAGSATSPAMSADGRLLAFITGGDDFLSAGQVWIKVLPDGEPTRLVTPKGPIFGPVFTEDGTHVVYTEVGRPEVGATWDTWSVPITGGEPTRVLPNASGLSFIGPHEVIYSEFKAGIHLGVVTSLDDRSRRREIYLPRHERGMAHYARLSPDRSAVLIVEMDRAGNWARCRLVPFEGESQGRPVGPDGSCRSAAWSPDGRWMYFAVSIAGHSHLWRQRYPGGEAEQITFGPTDERTVAVAPDGRALLTSLGRNQSTIWLHEPGGERVVTTESYAAGPKLSGDARRVYFIAAHEADKGLSLWRLELATGHKELLLSGFAIESYDVAPDERQLAFTARGAGPPELWIAPLDRHAPPMLLAKGADSVAVDDAGRIYYRSLGSAANSLHRVNADGSGDQPLLGRPILEFQAVSPDGKWVAVDLATENAVPGAYLVPVAGGKPFLLAEGWWPSRWSGDGRSLYLEVGASDDTRNHGRTLVLPLGSDGLPALPSRPLTTELTLIPHEELLLSPGPDPSTYVYLKFERRQNIYRIPLHP